MTYKEIINSKILKYSNLPNSDKIESPNNYDFSSEEDLFGTKMNEENLNDKMNSDYTTFKKEEKIIDNNTSYNENKITKFDFAIIAQKNSSNIINDNSKNNKNKKLNNNGLKKRGRKRKRNDITCDETADDKKHDRYSDDNMRKKCVNIILKMALEFINDKIKEKYKGNLGFGKFKKQLKILKQNKKVNLTVDTEKTFVNKTLEDIFSENISSRFNNYPPTYNKVLIESLLNESDAEKKDYFNKLFKVTFLDCLKCFLDDENNLEELNGFKKMSDIKDSLIEQYGKNYVEMLEHYLNNFENIINNKKGRKAKKILE